jgi:bacterioferritin
MRDEEEHIDFLETQLDLIAKLGHDLYAQHHVGEPHTRTGFTISTMEQD